MKEFIEFYEKNKSNKIHVINIDPVKFIVREITWKEGLLIDAKSFRKKYYNPNDTETYPVPPLLVEIDYMTRGLVSMNKEEFSNLSMKEFETIQLILATKNEVKSENAVDLDELDPSKDLQ